MALPLSYTRQLNAEFRTPYLNMGGTGFEPVKAEPTGLQPVPFDHLGISPLQEEACCCPGTARPEERTSTVEREKKHGRRTQKNRGGPLGFHHLSSTETGIH